MEVITPNWYSSLSPELLAIDDSHISNYFHYCHYFLNAWDTVFYKHSVKEMTSSKIKEKVSFVCVSSNRPIRCDRCAVSILNAIFESALGEIQ